MRINPRGGIAIYRLRYILRKNDKHNALGLWKGKQFITSVVIEKKPTMNDVFRLQNKCNLCIDWENIWDRFQRGVFLKQCKICGEYFETISHKQIYCSKECKIKGRRIRQKRYYENNRWRILKKKREERLFIKNQNHNIISEEIINKGKLPEGFNQIDCPNDLGGSKIREHRNTDEYEEHELIKREKRRLGL